MDVVGLRELFRSGVTVAQARYRATVALDPADGNQSRDTETELVLDRLAVAGITLAQNKVTDVWGDLLQALLDIFRLALVDEQTIRRVYAPPRQADFLMAVIERVLLLGGYLNQTKQFDLARQLVMQTPDPKYPHYYWVRYAVTMVARGELKAFKGKKSLIPPAAEYVRTRPQFFRLFDDSMDSTVNNMCQFDFFNCALAIHLSNRTEECYPNFGLYWNHRTTPIVVDLVSGGPARTALGDVDNARLAEILRELDALAAHAFFGFSGWDRNSWEDGQVTAFLKAHPPNPLNGRGDR